jgi:hypothetical protein
MLLWADGSRGPGVQAAPALARAFRDGRDLVECDPRRVTMPSVIRATSREGIFPSATGF